MESFYQLVAEIDAQYNKVARAQALDANTIRLAGLVSASTVFLEIIQRSSNFDLATIMALVVGSGTSGLAALAERRLNSSLYHETRARIEANNDAINQQLATLFMQSPGLVFDFPPHHKTYLRDRGQGKKGAEVLEMLHPSKGTTVREMESRLIRDRENDGKYRTGPEEVEDIVDSLVGIRLVRSRAVDVLSPSRYLPTPLGRYVHKQKFLIG